MGGTHLLKSVLHVVLLLLMVLICSVQINGDSFFNPRFSRAPHYTASQLYQTSVGFESINGMIGCYGDFNSDKYTDIFAISQNKSEVTLYLWNTNNYRFEASSVSIHYDFAKIVSVAASDFNHDGKLDLLVQLNPWNMTTNPPTLNTTTTNLMIYFGDYSILYNNMRLPDAAAGQVSIFDYNADLLPDLIGNTRSEGGSLVRSVWLNEQGSSSWSVFAFGAADLPALSDPHSTASIDFNGDCMPDLFMTNVAGFSEVWIMNTQIGQFEKHPTLGNIQNKLGQGQVTFADVDGDGAIDVIFPVCYPSNTCEQENSVHIHYNVQKPICKGLFSKNCVKSTGLCVADNSFSIEDFTTSSSTANTVILPASQLAKSRMFTSATAGVPLTLAAGDYNLDRYPDLLIPVLPSNNISQTTLWKNIPCTNDLCGSAATKANRRTFTLVTQGTEAMTSQIGGYRASWFDIDEDGSTDIITMLEATNSVSQKIMSVSAITNNFFNDGYFVKALGLNGICTVNCGIKDISLGVKPYGVNQHGTAWKFTWSDLNGNQLALAVPQLSQSAYNSLQTPYVLTGIGRPSNYIDYVYMGVPIKAKGFYNSWPGIIPNSQVVVAPYPADSPASWALELYIAPSGALLWIAIAVIVCLIISGGGIIFFQWREKKADEAEKKEKEHLFSFNAM